MERLDQLFVLLKKIILQFAESFLPAPLLPFLSILVSITAIAIFAPLTMMYLTWLERKVIGRMQNRFGPNRVGIYGLLQPIADGIKMLTKEDVIPLGADRVTHFLAPVAVVVPSLLLFSVLPFGRNMTAVNLDIGLLFFIAVSSIGTLAIFMGGWASRNKFSLLGAMRAFAQMISYEVPLVLSVVTVVMIVGSLSTEKIVEAQSGWGGLRWFVFTPWGFVGFMLFFICSVSEVNRTPFDIPEGESEIVAGFHTEYSGMKFALFYMAEFLGAFAYSAMAATLFLGGWQGPLLPSWLWFGLKTFCLVFTMIWLRGTFPRFRVDQLMSYAWKFLFPMGLSNILAAGIWYHTPFPLSFIFATWILLLSFIGLSRLNPTGTRLERRTYRFAE
ncbi:MAG: NADH-quinone oxidoreductase subunit NuoH [Candidatus Omnitrophica bacterium]|nr:NADH-quinone oxidoreductase subunit NuoH [Candidatus Omnitrophota bacterium]